MSKPLETVIRRAAVAASTASAFVIATAVPAMAEVPEDWSNPAEMSWLHLLALILGIPAVLGIVITVLTLLPSLLRGEGMPGGDHEVVQWVGGPGEGTALAEPGADEKSSGTGGASARW